MLNSRFNVLHAVRRVTVLNEGKQTPGLDTVLIKNKVERMILVDKIKATRLLDYQPMPVIRVYLPNPNWKTKPFGIPTIMNRCFQAIVLNALEPEWEARFEANSYGFRPGRSAYDAIKQLFNVLSVKARGQNLKN